MPFVSATAITAATAVAGTGFSLFGSIQNSKAAKEQAQASQRAEAARQEQSRLEAIRRERDILRTAQVQRAQALQTAINSGQTSPTQTSLFGGIEGAVAGQTSQGTTATEENLALSNQVFAANQDIARAQTAKADAAAFTDFGKTLFQNSQTIGKVGETSINSLSRTSSNSLTYDPFIVE